MNEAFKVVKIINGRFFSQVIQGKGQIEYIIGKVARIPAHLYNAGAGVFVYDNLEEAKQECINYNYHISLQEFVRRVAILRCDCWDKRKLPAGTFRMIELAENVDFNFWENPGESAYMRVIPREIVKE